MPEIPQLQEQQQINVRQPIDLRSMESADDMGNAIARAGEGLTRAALSVAEIHERKSQTQRILDNEQAKQKFIDAALYADDFARQAANADGSDLSSIWNEIYEDQTKQIADQYKDSQTNQQVNTTRQAIKNQFQNSLDDDARKLSYAHMGKQVESIISNGENNLRKNPALFDAQMQDGYNTFYGASKLGGLNSDQAAEAWKKTANKYVSAVIEKYIQDGETDPRAYDKAKAFLKDKGSKYMDEKDFQSTFDRIVITQHRQYEMEVAKANRDERALEKKHKQQTEAETAVPIMMIGKGDPESIKAGINLADSQYAAGRITDSQHDDVLKFAKHKSDPNIDDRATKLLFDKRITDDDPDFDKIRKDVLSAATPGKDGAVPSLKPGTASQLLYKIESMEKADKDPAFSTEEKQYMKIKLADKWRKPPFMSTEAWDSQLSNGYAADLRSITGYAKKNGIDLFRATDAIIKANKTPRDLSPSYVSGIPNEKQEDVITFKQALNDYVDAFNKETNTAKMKERDWTIKGYIGLDPGETNREAYVKKRSEILEEVKKNAKRRLEWLQRQKKVKK